MKLSSDQAKVYASITKWLKGDARQASLFESPPPLLRMGGYAGTGKTTLLSKLAAETKLLVAYVAYTGRASSLLARKFKAAGILTTGKTRGSRTSSESLEDITYEPGSPEEKRPFVGTIHRLLYKPVIDKQTEELMGWTKRDELDRKYGLIVIDEASMVGDDLLEDLQSFGVPILAVGDHGQLPPVMASGSLMRSPDLRLETIHRQAEGSPIIALSKHIREGRWLSDFESDGKAVTFRYHEELDDVLRAAYAGRKRGGLNEVAVICWMNKTRVRLNGAARRVLGFSGQPAQGEQVICLKNDPPIYNGMRGFLTKASEVGGRPWHLTMKVTFPDEDLKGQAILANAAQFNRDRPFSSVEELQDRGINAPTMSLGGSLYDFGYAMTAHKMQGSQADHVIVFVDRRENPLNEEFRRWIYTACTRASERVTILRG